MAKSSGGTRATSSGGTTSAIPLESNPLAFRGVIYETEEAAKKAANDEYELYKKLNYEYFEHNDKLTKAQQELDSAQKGVMAASMYRDRGARGARYWSEANERLDVAKRAVKNAEEELNKYEKSKNYKQLQKLLGYGYSTDYSEYIRMK